MNNRGIRRWALLGALVSAALLAPACERNVPKEGTDNEGLVNEAQKNETLPAEQQPATGGSGLQQQQTDQGVEMPPPEQYQNGAPNYSRGEERQEDLPTQ